MDPRTKILRLAFQVLADTSDRPLRWVEQLLENWDSINELHDRLDDDLSRSLFHWYLAGQISREMGKADRFKRFRAFRGVHNEQRWQDYRSRADALMKEPGGTVSESLDEVIETNVLNGYVIEDVVQPQAGDVVFDIGSFNGNNAIQFAKLVGDTGRVYTFEPSPRLFPVVSQNCAAYPSITAVNLGVAEREKTVEFALQGSRTRPSVGNVEDPQDKAELKLTTIDSFVRKEKIRQVNFMKFDIEGSEVDALRGAVNTLRNHRPTCMVAIYHRPSDIFRIPGLIDSYGLWYSFKLRHYHWLPREMVLFAIPRHQRAGM